jgi:unsaturated rhamnogalacturonyl hydrolase
VLNKGKLTDNWHESSGSGMFVYAIKTGVDRGYLDSSYLDVANKGWAGMKTKLATTSDGSPVIRDSVEGMGVQVDYAGYVGKQRVENLPHGLCAVMLASSVMDEFKH